MAIPSSSIIDYWIRSEPMQVHFLGWRSDTLTLQQAGWQFSMEQDVCHQSMMMCMQHPAADLFGFTNRMTMRYMHDMTPEYMRQVILNVQYMACRKNVIIEESMLAGCVPVDCEPVYMGRERKSLDDFQLFTTVPLARTEGIIIDPTDVNHMLDLIHKAQLPKQAEIRKRQEGEDAMPQMNFHAQIMSVV